MLIVGLGNPGKEYEKTRHNIGFMFVDEIAKSFSVNFKLEKKHQANIAEFLYNGKKHMLVKPITYMNLSGNALRSIVEYYKIPLNEILIVVDDLDLETGKLRIKPSGSSGGHNGLKSIFENLKTQEIARIRIGISKTTSKDTKDYVLGVISKNEMAVINNTLSYAPNIAIDYINNDINYIMNKYNGMKM